MKIYIATRFTNKEEADRIARILEEKGHEVTVKWWEKHKPIHEDGYDKHVKLAMQYAIEDLKGVKKCDVFILLTTPGIGSGMHVELGAAIILYELYGKPAIFVVGKYVNNCLFYYHPAVKRRKTIEEVLSELGIL